MGILSRVFAKKDWREALDAELVNKLEKLLKRTKTYEDAYQQADDPAMAQLWVAVAEMFYQMDRMNGRIRELEKRQDELLYALEGGDVTEQRLPDNELRDSLDNY